ncbi:MAG: hypothetical protein WC498_03260 [Candidatus Saccharimonadales bacterium]
MSIFVLQQKDMQRKPVLFTFAYGNKTMAGTRRRWADIIRLGRVNRWLIFALNTFLLAAAVTLAILVIMVEGKQSWITLLWLLPLSSLAPGTVRLFNLQMGKGYTLTSEKVILEEIVNDANNNMKAPRHDS